MKARLSADWGAVRSAISHVAVISLAVVAGVGLLAGFAVVAPGAFAVAGAGALGLGVAVGMGKLGDTMWHWSHGDKASVSHLSLRDHASYHAHGLS